MSDETELVKAASEGAGAGAVRAMLEPFTPPIVETTQTITDLVRYQRWKIQIWIAERARRYLEERGIEPNTVPLKILVPLLDAASLEEEDDEEMHARWAALLANAAAGEYGAHVSPAFSRILAEITPEEASLLQGLAEAETTQGEGFAQLGSRLRGPQASDEMMVRVQNLERLSLVEVRQPNLELRELRSELEARLQRLEPDEPSEVERRRWESLTAPRHGHGELDRWGRFRWWAVWADTEGVIFGITDLGLAFISACTPPTGAQTGAQ